MQPNPAWLDALLEDYPQSLPAYQPRNLPIEAAQHLIEHWAQRWALHAQADEVQSLRLSPALLGRVLAKDLTAPIDLPSWDNAAMDGYAFAGELLSAGQPLRLRVKATVLAGHRGALPEVGAGECVRIMTGAPMPPGCDTVVPLELIQAACPQANLPEKAPMTPPGSETHITLEPHVVQAGANCRRRGQDVAAAQVVLHAGQVLSAAAIGLAASLGLSHLSVLRRLRVAYFSTGDELRDPTAGNAASPQMGEIFDSNRFTLMAMLSKMGFELIDLGHVPDEPTAIAGALARARVCCADVLITSAGASMGDADHTRALMQRHAQAVFWQLALRPGRPMTVGQILPEDAPSNIPTSPKTPEWGVRGLDATRRPMLLLGLPGNPVAACVVLHCVARAALLRLAGVRHSVQPPLLGAHTTEAIAKKPGRTEVLRALLLPPKQAGENPRVQVCGNQSSSALLPLVQANALIVLGQDMGAVSPGQIVSVLLLENAALPF